MKKFVQNLQNKSEGIRKAVMWFGVSFIMAIIFGIWVWTWPSLFSLPEETAANQNLKQELPGVWQEFKGQINILKDLWQR